MPRQIDTIIKNERDNLKKNSKEVYFKFYILVDQARNARIIADKFREHHMKLIRHFNGIIKDVTNYSRIALENFAVLELWKLFDRKSAFNIWEVAEFLNIPSLGLWLKTNIKNIENDRGLICEWRHDAIGHRGKAGYYAQAMRVIKFKDGRISEQRLRDFLVDFLCKIDQELWNTDITDIKPGMRASEESFKQQVEKEMKEIFKDYDDKK